MRQRLLTGIAIALFAWAGTAHASPITYTETATGNGVLDGKAFTNALVTMTFSGDTSHVGPFGDPGCPTCLVNVPLTGRVTVAGVGTDTFTDGIGVIGAPDPLADFGNKPGVVFVDDHPGTSGLTLLMTVSNGLLGYGLASSIGPIPGASLFVDAVFPTTSGNFQWTSTPETSTFSATAVPEPASMVLVGTGLIGAMTRRRKNRKA